MRAGDRYAMTIVPQVVSRNDVLSLPLRDVDSGSEIATPLGERQRLAMTISVVSC